MYLCIRANEVYSFIPPKSSHHFHLIITPEPFLVMLMKFLHPAFKWHLMKSLPEVNVTWFLILRAEYKLRMFENEVLMRIFAPKMDEVTGCSRKFTMKMSVTCMPHEISE